MLCCLMDSIQNFLVATHGLVTASWLNAIIAVCSVTAACKIFVSVRGKLKMTKKRDKKRVACANAIAALETKLSTSQRLSDEEVKTITGYDINTLLSKLKKGELKPSKVLQAYQIKALEVHKKTNCLVCPIPEAEKWAKELETCSERGPLYGLPVSLKENYGLQGTDSTGGCASYIDKIYEKDAVLVQVLKKQGAIPFVRTNIPQTMFSWETTNPIFGATVNYHDTSRGVGGSSGGEACLVSGGGSIVGLGSDAGGSIRIPCNMCGTYGFKPTVNRMSSNGTHPILKGECLVNTGYGPIGRDMSSVVTVFRALADPIMFDLDPKVPVMPFAEQVFSDKRRLRIGYYTDDGYLTPVPAMREGVTLAVNALKAAGHELIPWKHKDFGYRNMPLFSASVFGDQGEEILGAVHHDSVDCAMRSTVLLLKLPRWLIWFIQPVVRLVEPRLLHILKRVISMKSVADWWKLSKEFMEFREDVISEWKKAELDVVICPGFACPALPFGSADHVQGAITYTNLYNVLDFPAGSMPVRTVTSSDVDAMQHYPLRGLWEKVIKKGMEGSVGLPVNVQVVALPWRDELCLRVMTELEAALKTHTTRK